jgi:fumarylacetoacetate (FAA) hydrolase
VTHKGKTDWPKGYSCIAEKRAIETLQDGQPKTNYMQFGDTIRIEMKDKDGRQVFGAIEQTIATSVVVKSRKSSLVSESP